MMTAESLNEAYRFSLRPIGAWATPWHADTIWGSLCWAWREAAGEDKLEAWLARFAAGDPPFVVSDGLPADLLPFPIGAQDQRPEGQKGKVLFCLQGSFTQPLAAPKEQQRPFLTHGLLHAQLNRNTDSTDGEEGKLFEMEQFTFSPQAFPKSEDRRLSVYVRADPDVLPALQTCWELLTWRGYGRRSSAGLGSFEIQEGPARCEWLDIKPWHSGFMSLSHFVPAQCDPKDGYWRVHVTNPKFAVDRVPRPFKGNLIQLTPGSRFRTSGPPRPFYGRMLPMRREGYEKALHYGLCLVAPYKWEDEQP
jgi:CRISPR-associated protein Csm4